MRCIRHPHRCEFAGAVAAREFLGIATIGFDPVSCFGRDQAGSDDLARQPQMRKLPKQHVPCGAGPIAGPQLLHRAELANQLANQFQTFGNHAQRADLPTRFGSQAALRRWNYLFAG